MICLAPDAETTVQSALQEARKTNVIRRVRGEREEREMSKQAYRAIIQENLAHKMDVLGTAIEELLQYCYTALKKNLSLMFSVQPFEHTAGFIGRRERETAG